MHSVATTSTKSPPVLKADIRRVLDRMQVQYREIKGGFECVHVPSIDVSSIDPTTARPSQHQQQSSAGSGEAGGGAITNRPSIVKKASKLSFKLKREKGKDRDASVDKSKGEVVGRTSVGTTTLGITQSGSSSFFNVPSSTHVEHHPQHNSNGATDAADTSPLSAPPTSFGASKSKILPPIPRDFGATPPSPPATAPPRSPSPLPTGEVDRDVFESIGNNTLSVRFEINIVKVSRVS